MLVRLYVYAALTFALLVPDVFAQQTISGSGNGAAATTQKVSVPLDPNRVNSPYCAKVWNFSLTNRGNTVYVEGGNLFKETIPLKNNIFTREVRFLAPWGSVKYMLVGNLDTGTISIESDTCRYRGVLQP